LFAWFYVLRNEILKFSCPEKSFYYTQAWEGCLVNLHVVVFSLPLLLRQGGSVFADVCLFVSSIMQKVTQLIFTKFHRAGTLCKAELATDELNIFDTFSNSE